MIDAQSHERCLKESYSRANHALNDVLEDHKDITALWRPDDGSGMHRVLRHMLEKRHGYVWMPMSDEGEGMTYCDLTAGGALKAVNQERNILWTHADLDISNRIIVGGIWQRSSSLALVRALWLRHLEICF